MTTRLNNFSSSRISLRSVRISDAGFLLQMENDPSVWSYSTTNEAPYTTQQIEQFCQAMQQCDCRADENGQLRLIIELDGNPIGAADLYHCDSKNRSAKIAILIYPACLRSLGYGKQALRQMIDHCTSLGYTELEAEITPQNEQSRNLFTSCGFVYTTTSNDVMIYTHNSTTTARPTI